MNFTLSFMSANFVAQQLDFNMTQGWGQGDRAANEYFRPEETFAGRFSTLLRQIKDLQFDAMDLWTAHLNPQWATDEQVAAAKRLIESNGLRVVSLAGWFGSTPEEFERACEIAVALDCPVLGGSTSMLEKDRAFTVETLKRHNLRLGLENHPEKNPAEMLAKIGDGTIGVTVDTGWFGTQGYDAARAIEELDQYVFHVHLKDVLEEGEHNTCRFGQGIVPLEEAVHALETIGYEGAISVEHEPELFDPTDDVRASHRLLRSWLQGEEVRES